MEPTDYELIDFIAIFSDTSVNREQMANRGFIIAAVLVLACSWSVEAKFGDKITVKEKDMMRKSIVFDKKTPDVFYCPMQKPATMNKLIVR